MNFETDAHWLWLIAAAILAAAEIVAPGVFLIFLAAAAAMTGVAALVTGVPFVFQLALFCLFALASVLVGKRWYARNPIASSDPLLNDRTSRMIGETVLVVTAIEGGSGRVKVGDGVWPAKGPDAEAGSRVRITGADGACLKVEPIAIATIEAPDPAE